VTGEWGLRHAPESFALGWSIGGRALVDLPEGACGMRAPRPGVYLFSAPGEASLVFPTRGFARMWNTA
jgi:hypothetical protein